MGWQRADLRRQDHGNNSDQKTIGMPAMPRRRPVPIVQACEEDTASSSKQAAGISAHGAANYSWFSSVSCWPLCICLAMANADRTATYITSSAIAMIQLVMGMEPLGPPMKCKETNPRIINARHGRTTKVALPAVTPLGNRRVTHSTRQIIDSAKPTDATILTIITPPIL